MSYAISVFLGVFFYDNLIMMGLKFLLDTLLSVQLGGPRNHLPLRNGKSALVLKK